MVETYFITVNRSMNLNYQIYRSLVRLETSILSSNISWLTNRYPRGRNPWFDIKRHFHPNEPKVMVDVGANIGQTAIELKHWFPVAALHSFEPVSDTFTRLTKTCASLPNTFAHRFALGEQNDSITINLTDTSELNSLRHTQSGSTPDKVRRSETLQVIRLDEFASNHNMSQIDVLKTDTEGCDLAVLMGAGKLLSKVSYVYCEVGFHGQDQQSSFTSILKFLADSGFQFAGFYEPARGPRPRLAVSFGNALFINSLPSTL